MVMELVIIALDPHMIPYVNVNKCKCYCYRGQGSLVASSDVLHNDSPSSSSKEHEHRSSCEDSGTLSILTCYFTCVMRRYLSPEHALTDFKWHRTGPLHVKLVNKAHHVGVVGNMTVQRSRFEPGTSRFPVQRSTAAPHVSIQGVPKKKVGFTNLDIV